MLRNCGHNESPSSLILFPSRSSLRFQTIQHLTGFRNEQDAFVLSAFPFIEVDRRGIEIAQVQPLATLLWNLRRQRDFDARSFDTGLSIVTADAAQMRA